MKWKINRTKYLKKKAEMKSKSLDAIQGTLRPIIPRQTIACGPSTSPSSSPFDSTFTFRSSSWDPKSHFPSQINQFHLNRALASVGSFHFI